jgi:hypothetical protein
VGYFLGISLGALGEQGVANAITGGSNIFFVLDAKLLYPTWKIVDALITQLEVGYNELINLSVTFEGAPSLTAKSLHEKKLGQGLGP